MRTISRSNVGPSGGAAARRRTPIIGMTRSETRMISFVRMVFSSCSKRVRDPERWNHSQSRLRQSSAAGDVAVVIAGEGVAIDGGHVVDAGQVEVPFRAEAVVDIERRGIV